MNDESGLPEPYGKRPPQQRLTLLLEEVEGDARQAVTNDVQTIVNLLLDEGWMELCLTLWL